MICIGSPTPLAQVLAAVCAAPGSVSFPDRPGGDAEGDDGVDRPAARPDSDDSQREQNPGGLCGAHQVLGTLTGRGAGLEPPAEAAFGNAEHRHDDHARCGERDPQG